MSFLTAAPDIISRLLYSGVGSGPMLEASAAWDGLAAELSSAAESFSSVTSGLVDGAWQGPAAQAMAAAAAPYSGWLQAAAAHASGAAAQAKAVAGAFESALAATVHPALVSANRSSLVQLVTSNWFGFNAPAIAAVEAEYEQMWAADVSAMVGYHGGVSAAAAQLTSLPAALRSLPGQLANAAATSPVGAFLQQIQTAETNFNSTLVNGELPFNESMVNGEVGLEKAVFGTNSALNGFVNRSFNAGNLLFGTGEQAVNVVLGAPFSQPGFNLSLLTGSPAQVFNSGAIGGPVGAFDQSLAAGADLAGLFPTQLNIGLGTPVQATLSLLGGPGAATSNPVGNLLQQLESSQINFNTNLVGNELGFNNSLLTNEVGLERAFFGSDNAFNGSIDRVFNVGNMVFGTGEQAVNTFYGAPVIQPGFNQSLLTGTAAQVFNSGAIGGLVNAFDQSLAAGADVAGLFLGA